jgi:cell wall-associated NlpC family hydrolase
MLRKISTTIIAVLVAATTALVAAPAAHAAPDTIIQNATPFTRGDQNVFRVKIHTEWGKSARIYLGARSHQWKPTRYGWVEFRVGRHTLRDNTPTTVTVKVYRNSRVLYTLRYRIADKHETRGEAILREARQEKGDRYRYGGTGPNAWDCSGLVAHAVRAATGKRLPHSSTGIRNAGQRVKSPRPGDVVWTPGHVSVYAGHGRVVEAARPGTRVREVPRWQHNPVYIRF